MTEVVPIRVVDAAPRPGWSQLVLTGRVTVGCAALFHQTALQVCAGGANVSVSCTAAEYLDASAIQILLCLRRELHRAGKKCEVSVSDALKASLRAAGL